MKLNKMLLIAFAALGLMVSGCASKKNDLSTIEAQKAQQLAKENHATRNHAHQTYGHAASLLQANGGAVSAGTRNSFKDAMAALKRALAGNDIEAIKKAEANLAKQSQNFSNEANANQNRQNTAVKALQPASHAVYFAFDSAVLEGAAGGVLEGYARWLLDNRDVNVTIEGNCDQRGSREYNLALGQQRADSVKKFLMSRGVQAGRLDTVSFGEERPVCQGSGESCWAQNRHADIVRR